MSRYENPKINVPGGAVKVVLIGIVVLIIVGVVVGSAVQIVDAGHRGVLLHWNAVDLDQLPLSEGLHFVTPFADSVVQMEIRTLKFVKATSAASKDL
ncbi:MAG: prohibitin family protein, partial [Nitrosopumilus sp.]